MIGEAAYARFDAFPDEPGPLQARRRFLLAHADTAELALAAKPSA